ncbi:hypothetical protein ABG067_006989 [Albugo candida]
MKKQKANLQRQLKEESERHQKEKRQQQLRILRLNRQEERKQYQLQKLSELHAKQKTVLKRKTEEVAAAKRMLMMHNLVREILDVQITLLGAHSDIRTYQDERLELALKIAQVEKSGCARTEDLKSLESWKRLLREKDELIRTLQAKVATVTKICDIATTPCCARCERVSIGIEEIENLFAERKTYEILSDDGLEDWISEKWSADDYDYVEGEEQLRAVKNRKRLEQNARADSVTCLEKASAGPRDSMEEIDRLLLHVSESKSDCCQCSGRCTTKLCACRANKQDFGNNCSCYALKCHNRPEKRLRLQKKHFG